MKSALVAAHSARRGRIETGQDIVVGVNKFDTTEPNPLTADLDGAIQTVDPAVESAAVQAVRQWRAERDGDPVRAEAARSALRRLREEARTTANLMPASLDCARAGVTTGEWADALREVFGEYRAPTGVGGVIGAAESAETGSVLWKAREAVRVTSEDLGGRLRLLVGKPGLDGHSNGAEQVAVRARDVGFEVVYQGIRLTPAQIVAAAVAEDVHCVGLSVLSGSHLELVPEVLDGLRAAGADDVPVIVGGIIPEADERKLLSLGVAAVFTPKDYGLTEMMAKIVDQIRLSRGLSAF
jgi:(2R)-ethylmalonyl-CoA mutase